MTRPVWATGRSLQVGGSGEGNLPGKSLTSITLDDTRRYIMGCTGHVGAFTENNIKGVWTEALFQFCIPYCPGQTRIAPRSTTDEADTSQMTPQERTVGENISSLQSYHSGRGVHSESRAISKLSRWHKSVTGKVVASPPGFFMVPRLKDVKRIRNVAELWRKGTFQGKSIVPLYKLLTAEGRKLAWRGCVNHWWNDSASKSAFNRLKKKIEQVVQLSEGSCKLNAPGCDQAWEKALKLYEGS